MKTMSRLGRTRWTVVPTATTMAVALLVASCSDGGRTEQEGTAPSTTVVTAPATSPDRTTSPTPSTTVVGNVPPIAVDGDGTTNVPHQRMQDGLESLPRSTLSDAEQSSLTYLRDLERLAQNVNEAMYTAWSHTLFMNIAASEATHTDAVMLLLERYGLPDPALQAQPGTFQDPTIQALYDGFIAEGLRSASAALAVGATIEERDIAVLRSGVSDAPDITLVFSNLEQASRNHLRVFVGQLEKIGLSYEPQVLSSEEYQAIITSPIERA